MPSYTDNYNMLKKDPVADASDTFNIETMLNDNWDIIDVIMKALEDGQTATEILTKLKTVDGAGSGLDADTVKSYVPVNKAGDTMTGILTVEKGDNSNYLLTVKNPGGSGKGIRVQAGTTSVGTELLSLLRHDGSNVMLVEGASVTFDVPVYRGDDQFYHEGNSDVIVEKGSNANGEYIRFSDGTQICWAEKTLVYASTYYLGSGNNWSYPASFTAKPRVLVTRYAVSSPPNIARSTPAGDGINGTLATVRVFATGSDSFSSGDEINATAFAIGRWK